MVVGARGYTGSELLPLLHRHPSFDLCAVGSGSASGERVSAHVDGLEDSGLVFSHILPESLETRRADALVLALPNGVAAPYVEAVERYCPETVIVDLSADYRFDGDWAYGQPERFRDRLARSRRIANPGCYATAAQLALAPLLDQLTGIPAAFGVSGFSGAGKTASRKNDPEVLADNLLPYSLVDHVHEKEVSLHIGRELRFLPHVAPFFRGISLTVAAELREPTRGDVLLDIFQEFYAHSPLVEVRSDVPEVKQIRGRHGVIIGGFSVSAASPERIALVAVLDNLLKGAASQAVQNLNLAFGFEELTGLEGR